MGAAFILPHSLRVQPVMLGTTWPQEHEAACSIWAGQEVKSRELSWLSPCPMLESVFPPQFKPL